MIDIDPLTGAGAQKQVLSEDWGSRGLTWSSNQAGVLYGLNARTDKRFTFDAVTGAEIGTAVPLSRNVGSVGIEFPPGVGVLYTCDSPNDLYEVDPQTGTVTTLASIALSGGLRQPGRALLPGQLHPAVAVRGIAG